MMPLTKGPVSARELRDAEVKRQALAEVRDSLNKQIADIDSALSQHPRESTSDLQRLAEGETWRTNSWGEYAFRTETNGSPVARLGPLVEAISRSPARKLVLGAYEYSLPSNAKFLNRRKV